MSPERARPVSELNQKVGSTTERARVSLLSGGRAASPFAPRSRAERSDRISSLTSYAGRVYRGLTKVERTGCRVPLPNGEHRSVRPIPHGLPVAISRARVHPPLVPPIPSLLGVWFVRFLPRVPPNGGFHLSCTQRYVYRNPPAARMAATSSSEVRLVRALGSERNGGDGGGTASGASEDTSRVYARVQRFRPLQPERRVEPEARSPRFKYRTRARNVHPAGPSRRPRSLSITFAVASTSPGH